MNIRIFDSSQTLGKAAAVSAAGLINAVIQKRNQAHIILATGASQFEMLRHLVQENIDWNKVIAFHLDEYLDLPDTHPASFRKYLKERFVDQAPELRAFHFIHGDMGDPQAECDRVGELLKAHPIDVAMIGIGENGHLAFNDPPADFETEEPYLIVDLDEACRRQQFGEGWFPSLEAVPMKAISMSIRQILKSRHLIVSVPDERKAVAVKGAIEGDISPDCPASILQKHPNCEIFLDKASASMLSTS